MDTRSTDTVLLSLIVPLRAKNGSSMRHDGRIYMEQTLENYEMPLSFPVRECLSDSCTCFVDSPHK
jgi:hypothetical protein